MRAFLYLERVCEILEPFQERLEWKSLNLKSFHILLNA